jgi:hypothetical protein
MSLFNEDSDNIIMNIDGKDIEMKHPICFGKEYDKWLVSRCGKVWSLTHNKLIKGAKGFIRRKDGSRVITEVKTYMSVSKGFWEDGSGYDENGKLGDRIRRNIKMHKMIIDTWKPLYDNPPEGIVREEWEKVRDFPSVYNHISKTICIDHIDDDPTNNHLDNLRRVTHWDNQASRKAKGI